MKLNLVGDIKQLMSLNDNVNASVQVMLIDVWQFIMNRAKENAPYLSWDLKRSIANDFNAISKWFAVVGSDLPYAMIREFVNNKNPQTKYYLERAYSEHKPEIFQIMAEDLNDKIKK